MRAYSEKNLLAEELKQISFIERLLTVSKVTLKLMLPRDIYFRAQVLCDDILDLTEQKFSLNDLIEMLWLDLLDEVIEKQNIKEIYSLLLEYDRGTPNVRLIHYQRRDIEEIPIYPVRKRVNHEIEVYECRMKRRLVLRGEVMLHDIAHVYPSHPFTVERILEILLIDFITKYRKGEIKSIISEFYIEN